MPAILGLPEKIIIKQNDTLISFTYHVDQTYQQSGAPNEIKEARTTIHGNFTHNNDEAAWNTKLFYIIKLRTGGCYEIDRFDASFEYTFSNTTRSITKVTKSHDNWDINNKHPGFFSGLEPGQKETFLIDEMMFILGEYGIVERSFSYIGNETIWLGDYDYEAYLYQVKTNFQINEQL